MKNKFYFKICKPITLLLFCLLIKISAHSQHLMLGFGDAKIEAGINFGPTFFLGDLGGKVGKGTTFIKDLNYELTKLMKGAFVTVYPNEWLGFRVAGQYTYVEGIDQIISTHGVDELWRKQRNLDFKSNMWELYGAIEIFPLQFINRNNEESDQALRPYFFGGLGAFHFNPMGSITDQNGNKTWHELKPLHTEGQGFAEYPDKKEYKLTQMNIPFGAGVKYLLNDNVNLGLELLYRKTFTDYIDDVSTTYIDPNLFDVYLDATNASLARRISDKTVGIVTPGVNRYEPGVQRGNPKNSDAYFSFLLKVGIRFGDGGYGNGGGYGGGGGNSSAYNRRASRSTRCPVRF